MKNAINPEEDHHHSLPRGTYLVRIILAVVLLLLSLGFFVAGGSAAQQQQYEIKWRAVRGFSVGVGSLASESHGVSQYRDASAVRMGVGLVSVGVMLIVGVVLLLWSPDGRRTVPPTNRFILNLLGWLSFCALLLACACFFPPWQVESISLYGVVVLLTGFVTVRNRLAREDWQGRVGIALPVGMVVAGFFDMDVFVGMALGLFVFVIGLVHLALLVSPIRRALEEPPAPSNG